VTLIDIKKLFEDEANQRLNELIDLNYYLDGCQTYSLPCLLHKGSCTRTSPAVVQEEYQIWEKYKTKIKPLVV